MYIHAHAYTYVGTCPNKNSSFCDRFFDGKNNIFRQKKNFPTDIPSNCVRQNNHGRKGVPMELDVPSGTLQWKSLVCWRAPPAEMGRAAGHISRMQRSLEIFFEKN